MTEFDKYVPGTPCWIDVSTTDAEGARAFYSKLFGWEYEIGSADSGFYTSCLVRGRRVAGLMELNSEMSAAGARPAWQTYIATEDVDDTVARVREAGGQVIMGPADVLDQGRWAFVTDPSGAAVGFWEPGLHTGAQLANEPGTFTWNELQTSDVESAKTFYAAAAGWQTEVMPSEVEGPPYFVATVGGEMVAGIMEASASPGGSTQSFWMTYFKVADCDKSVERVRESGGAVMMARIDSPQGPFGVVADPYGAVFAVISDPA
ncbi:MAG: VOC family protein [Actinomycetota bacterium]